MKRTMLMTVLLATITAVATAAPEGDRPRRKPRADRPARMKMADRLEKLPEALDLTEDQKAKAAPIIADFIASHKELVGSLKDKLAAARNATRQAARAVRKDPTKDNKKALADARKANAEAAKPLRELTDKLVTDLSAVLNEKQTAKLKAMFRRGRVRARRDRPGGFIPFRAILKLKGITDEQKQKIKAIAEQLRKDFAALRGDEAKPEPGQAAKIVKAARAKIMALLTDDQKAALGKMGRGRPGGFLARMLKGLELTDEQEQKIKAAHAEHIKKVKALRERGKRLERDKMRDLWKALVADLKEILTDDQAKALEAKLDEMRKNRPDRRNRRNRGDRPGRGRQGDAAEE